jgi:hypothetical protein
MAMAGAQRRRLQRLHAQVSAGAAAAGPPSDPSTLRDPTRDRPVPDPLEPVPLLRADGESDTDPLLSPEQIQQFKTDGFVLKRWGGVQYTRNELTRLQDYMWEHFPDGIRRDDPATWLDPYELPSWQSEVRERGDDTDYVTATATGTGWKWHQGGVEPWIRGMLHSNDWITGVVEQMVGGPLREAERARGIYNLFPTSNLDGCKKKLRRRLLRCQLAAFKPIICQDRLVTNVRKPHTTRTTLRVFAQGPSARAAPRHLQLSGHRHDAGGRRTRSRRYRLMPSTPAPFARLLDQTSCRPD